MKRVIKFVSGKLGFLAAVALAAVIGGVSTGAVMASIPDGDGNVNTCYVNSGGDLRVIDTANDSCTGSETALNLSEATLNANTAYFRIKNGAVDTASMRNIDDYVFYDGTDPDTLEGYCLKVSFEPNTTLGLINGVFSAPTIRNLGADGNYNTNRACDNDSAYNAFIGTHEFDETSAWFSK